MAQNRSILYPSTKRGKENQVSTLLHVHRLSVDTTDSQLQQLFEGAGRVITCDVVTDGPTRISKVIGFVEMATEKEA